MSRVEYAVFLGLDVGKEEHHACGLDPEGRRVHDKPLPQSEEKIREVLQTLVIGGPVLVVVDQPASIGALAVTVARSLGIDVAYLPGLAMRRIADLHPGNAKTDARDAFVIADAARTMPHALRRVDTGDEALADLEVIVGFDDDLAGEVTRISNRIRGLLTQVHPALERVLGPKIQHPAVIELLIRFGGPQGLAKATRRQLLVAIKTRAPRSYEALLVAVTQALTEQTVTVPGTRAAELVLPKLATTLSGLLAQRADAAKQIEEMLDAHPLSKVLTSMPGIGVRTGARILLEVGDGSSFPTSGHLAAYAGLAPVTRRSGTSIRGEHPSRAGNKHLKRAFFLAAFAALSDPTSRAYYDRKRSCDPSRVATARRGMPGVTRSSTGLSVWLLRLCPASGARASGTLRLAVCRVVLCCGWPLRRPVHCSPVALASLRVPSPSLFRYGRGWLRRHSMWTPPGVGRRPVRRLSHGRLPVMLVPLAAVALASSLARASEEASVTPLSPSY